jgi:hypothetical protein
MRLLVPIIRIIKKKDKALQQERNAESTLIFTDKVAPTVPYFDSIKAFKKLDDKIKKEEAIKINP